MPLCSTCFQPECLESTEGERPSPGSHATRVAPGERAYRGYGDWALHPEEASFLLHRGYALVEGRKTHVYFDHNEAYVAQVHVSGTQTAANHWDA